MKRIKFIILFVTLSTLLSSQNLEVEGSAKITVMDPATASAVPVAQEPDGTLSLISSSSTSYSIGDVAHGGVIFWIDGTGEHGLIIAPSDAGTGAWYNGTNIETGAMRWGAYGGALNSEHIITIQGTGDYAAALAAVYVAYEYGDWYLPSINELQLIFSNLSTINASLATIGAPNINAAPLNYYWSSTEKDVDEAWLISFFDGGSIVDSKNTPIWAVRPVRSF